MDSVAEVGQGEKYGLALTRPPMPWPGGGDAGGPLRSLRHAHQAVAVFGIVNTKFGSKKMRLEYTTVAEKALRWSGWH